TTSSVHNVVTVLQDVEEWMKPTIANAKKFRALTGKPLVKALTDKELAKIEQDSKEQMVQEIDIIIGVEMKQEQIPPEYIVSDFCKLFDLKPDQFQIKSLKKGSLIVDGTIKFEKDVNPMTVRMFSDKLAESKLNELRKNIEIFLLMCNPPKPYHNTNINKTYALRGEVLFNSDWDRIYSPKHTYWNGALNDKRDRGKHSYFCPVGWKRCSLRVTGAENGDDFYNSFKGWHIAYHGTKFEYALSILLSGLATGIVNVHGKGVYASPSIIYVAHPRYSSIKEIEPENRSYFSKTGNANYAQFALELRIHPSCISKIGCETLKFSRNSRRNAKIDPNFKNGELEWLLTGSDFFDFDSPDRKVVCSGIMIRTTDKHPALLKDSAWWWNVICQEWCTPELNAKRNRETANCVLDKYNKREYTKLLFVSKEKQTIKIQKKLFIRVCHRNISRSIFPLSFLFFALLLKRSFEKNTCSNNKNLSKATNLYTQINLPIKVTYFK
ncbi:hypothetical protein RFI_26632, partial [Reticulomyxa filosa]